MPLPLILAGPILRRVEPMLVSVWIALSQPLRVQLRLWDGLVKDDGDGLSNESGNDTLFHTDRAMLPPTDSQPVEESARPFPVGDNLHIAVVSIKLPPNVALVPDRVYSYNLILRREPSLIPVEDLKSLHLLRDDPVDGKPNLALGYELDVLPSFELPPLELTDLRLLHGSCRRINRDFEDGLSWVDDLIREARLGLPNPIDPLKPLKRPHQLLLTGDQIYADDVPLPLLPQLIERGRELLGNNEFLPTRWPKQTAATFWPADAKHFPPALRHQLITTEARFTTVDTHSHLISFGEFAAMYLFNFCNALWDLNALKRFDDIIADVTTLPDTWGALFKRVKPKKDVEIDDELLQQSLKLLFEALPKDDLRRALKTHDVDDPNPEERKRRPLNHKNLTPQKLAALSEEERNKFKEIYKFAATLPAEKLKKFQEFFKDLREDLGGKYEPVKSKRRLEVEMFFNSLAKVRRALANVPTYMMFDDHDVTDDWNLNPIWRNRVFTSPLGRTLVRNGMLAYALFQGWGNDPVKFEDGKHAELLLRASQLFPTGLTVPPQEEFQVANLIDELLGFGGEENPQITWHYSVQGAKHVVLVMDNRTRRSFVSDIGPPGNASLAALKEQIPSGPRPAGIEVVFVVASLPVIGPPLFDEVIAPLSYRVYDLMSYKSHGNEQLKSMPGTNPDAIEAWAFDPVTFEALLKRLEPYRRVVLLSGDVHYAAGQFLSYWKKDDQEPARFAQFNSSGLRNVMPDFIRLTDRSFPLAQRIIRAGIGITRLGWDKNAPPPLSPAEPENAVPAIGAKLQKSPVMIPAGGWPEGTTEARPPDWAWRAHVVRDERKDSERPESARPRPLAAGVNANTLEGYREIAARHASQFKKMQHGRQILFANNLGVIRFDIAEQDGRRTLDVIQELYAVHPEAPNPVKPEIYTLHRVTLAVLSGPKLDEKKPAIGAEHG